MEAPTPDVKSVFDRAAEIHSPADREAYLAEACAGAPDVRRQVDALLQAHAQAGSFLDVPHPAAGRVDPDLTGACSPPNGNVPTETVGSIIAGKFKLLQEIGEGGMGSVFMADQTSPVKRRVAVKVIKAGMDSARVLARFEAERQALALMDHPNISKVLDAGTTNSGRPFFVMELVKGIPLTQFCDENRLDVPDRLNLFTQICSAVQHAHQKGIIHRDLKPGNILVENHDDKPVPKVIDFGLAKATSGIQLSEKTLFTALGTVAGTPLYMAPEQAKFNAIDVDTRVDVYALGVILYELLTGTTPIERATLDKAAFDEILRVIREQEPPTPSKRLSSSDSKPSVAANRRSEPAKLGRFVQGELDWIVMKALSKERDRRYETASGFAKDVERFLNHEPVLAGPPSARYKLRKFVQRNRLHVVASGLVLLTLIGGIIGTTIGYFRAQAARADAETAQGAEAERATAEERAKRHALEEQAKAEKAEDETLAAYRASTDDAIEQLIGSKSVFGLLETAYLEKTLKRWQAFANRQGDDEHSQAVRAEGHYHVALLLARLGRKEDARMEFQEARTIYHSMTEQFFTVPKYEQNLAMTQNSLGILLKDQGKSEEAQTSLLAARDIQIKLVDQFPIEPDYQQNLARTHNNLGTLLRGLSKTKESRAAFETARDLLDKLVHRFPGSPEYQKELATTRNNLGNLLAQLGKRDEALAEYQGARDQQRKLVDEFATVPAYQQDLARTHNNLGALLKALRKDDDARTEFQTARDLHKELVAKFPAVLTYQIELGASYFNFGTLMGFEGNPAASLEWYDLAIRTLQPVYEREPREVIARVVLRNSHWNRAFAYDRLQKPALAAKDWGRAIDLSPPAEQMRFRASRVTSQMRAGLVAEAIADVAELTKSSAWNADQWYDFACVYAVASGKFADKKQEYADRAMELLLKATKAGYKNAAHMAKDTDLDPLRGREDFKKLIEALEREDKK